MKQTWPKSRVYSRFCTPLLKFRLLKCRPISSQLLCPISESIHTLFQCPFVTTEQTHWPCLLLSSPEALSLQSPVCITQQERTTSWLQVTKHPSSCPARCPFSQWTVDDLAWQTCLYVPLPVPQNNSTILTNVASHAQWKLNCSLHKQACDDQLPGRDPFMGHSEDKREQGWDVRAWESVE